MSGDSRERPCIATCCARPRKERVPERVQNEGRTLLMRNATLCCFFMVEGSVCPLAVPDTTRPSPQVVFLRLSSVFLRSPRLAG